MSRFTKAVRSQAMSRVLFEGASGSGKTTAALTLAKTFGKIAVIDTENSSASLYSDIADFDVLNLAPPYEPERYVEAIQEAEAAGYDVIVIDSITPEWSGQGGCLEIKDKLGGRFQDWAKVSPRHDKFVQAMLRSKCHIIACCRSKQAYIVDEQTKKVTKAGVEPQQRDGLDYEMTVVFQLNHQHIATATKDRTRLFDGREAPITAETGKRLLEWLHSGVKAPAPAPVVPAAIASVSDTSARDTARTLYAKLKLTAPEKADAIKAQHAQDYAAMAKALEEALRG